jgi:tetratricopeptide (TPR) repeat protein
MTPSTHRGQSVEQHGRADRGGVVNQAARDAYYVDQRGAEQVFLAPLRPAVERAELEPTVRGRESLLATLHGLLVEGSPGARVRVLHGMGGCGKTTVARELARTALAMGIPAWWIAATTSESVASGMQAVAVMLGADPDRLRMGSVPEIVWEHFAALPGPWLLVFDNADDPHHVLCPGGGAVTGGSGWLRPVDNAGLIVVTSRDSSRETWGGGRCRWLVTHSIPPLGAAEGGAVLSELAGDAAGRSAEAQALSRRLGGLPLALRIVGSYLAEAARIPARLAGPGTIRTFTDYHQSLSDGGMRDLFPAGDTQLTDDQARALIGRTWELSLDLLASRGMPDARTLLRLMACFADAAIPYDLVLRPDILAEDDSLSAITGSRVWRLLQALAGMGLVDLREPADPQARDAGGYTAELHPLVRDANAAHLDVTEDPTRFPALAVRLVAVAADAEDTGVPEDPAMWPWWQAITPHAAYLLRMIATADRIPDQIVEQSCHAATLAARYLHARGLYGPAQLEYRAVLDIASRVLGDEHPHTLDRRHRFALLVQDQGDLAAAEAEFRTVLASRRRVLGEEHPDTLDTRRALAGVLHARGDLAAAEPEFRTVLASQRRVLGEEHPNTLVTRHVLAVVLRDRGDLEAAEPEYRAVLATARRVFGEENLYTLLPWHNLAVLLHDQGDLEVAEAEFRAVLAISRRVFGEEFRITLATRHALATVLRDRGELMTAEIELRAVLTIQQRVLGDEHPDTLATRNTLALLLRNRGELTVAAAEFQAVLVNRRRVLGDEHPDTLATRHALAGLPDPATSRDPTTT